MLEAVGHEFMEAFFGCCESVLAEDGLLVLQVMIGWKQESLCPLSFPVWLYFHECKMPWSLYLFYGFNLNTLLTVLGGWSCFSSYQYQMNVMMSTGKVQIS